MARPAAGRRVAAIDIGTNTVLLLVAAETDGEPVAVLERATITRLGQGVDRTGRLADDALARTLDCLREYADLARGAGASRIVAASTSAARDAQNGAAFLDAARAILGAELGIVDGDEEARLTFEGATAGLDVEGPVTVFDVGGGSTEIIHADLLRAPLPLSRVRYAVSKNVGSVRLTERHVKHDPPTPAELDAIRADARAALSDVPTQAGATLVGVAGTVTTLAAIEQSLPTYEPERVHGSRLDRRSVDAAIARLAALPLAERLHVTGLEPARADVIVAGALLVEAVLDWSSARELVVSDRGVRWGLALRALTSP